MPLPGAALALPRGAAAANVTVSPASQEVLVTGNGDNAAAQLLVNLSQPEAAEVRVRYKTAGGTAGGGADFESASGELVFAPGETTKTLSTAVFAGWRPRPLLFRVLFTDASGGNDVSPDTALVTIRSLLPPSSTLGVLPLLDPLTPDGTVVFELKADGGRFSAAGLGTWGAVTLRWFTTDEAGALAARDDAVMSKFKSRLPKKLPAGFSGSGLQVYRLGTSRRKSCDALAGAKRVAVPGPALVDEVAGAAGASAVYTVKKRLTTKGCNMIRVVWKGVEVARTVVDLQ